MRLNRRLKMIVEQIPPCEILADIGTDHAYVPIYAVKTGLCDRALAVDIRTGPLSAAANNIKRHGLEKLIETRHGDGLGPVRLSECDVVVVAGMGGLLIRDILSSAQDKAKTANLLILQPNSAAEALRKWLYENGFALTCERLVKDAGKIYCFINAKWDGKAESKGEFTYYVGDKVFCGNEPLIEEYLRRKLRTVEVIIGGRSKKRNNESSTCGKCLYYGPVMTEMDAEGDDGYNREASGGSGRISEMSTATLINIRNKIKERMKQL
ncbi:MAG: tRNA (adenine(22)-N(1))-methyltransferase [Acetivibrionales bacterium]|jgi:tRNA (adenine22-N1)-methyltransferase